MVPEGWEQVRLDRHAKHVTSGSRGWAEYYSDTGDVFVRITNLRRSSITPDWSNTKHVKLPDGMREGLRTRLQRGDILISITADLGVIGYIHDEPDAPHYINQHVALVRLDQRKIEPEFVAYLLSSSEMNNAIQRLNDAGAKAGLSLPTIRSIPVKLPPLPEQRKIADILSTWDRAIETTEALLATARTQKRALMQSLLTGKRRFPEFEGQAWKEVRLGDVAKIYDGTHSTPKYVETGVPFFSVEHVTKDNFSETKFISEEVFEKENRRVKLERGDILMTRIGDIGTARLLDWDVRASFYVSLALIKSDSCVVSRYLSQYINAQPFQKELHKRMIHVAFPKKINLGEIGNCIVQLPSISEQTRIADVLGDADGEISTFIGEIERLRTEKKALMQQLLTGKRRVVV
jgi:type I restriction enzyme S subunit